MKKFKVGDIIQSFANPINTGVILFIDEGAFKIFLFASNRTELLSTTCLHHGLFKKVS